MQKTIAPSALRVALIYAAVSIVWIVAADRALGVLIDDPRLLSAAQSSKGWLFVALASLILYWLVDREVLAKRKAEHRASAAAQDLATEERRFRQLFEGSPLPMWIYDTETLQFLAVNDVAVTRYGYSPEEFMVMTIKDIRPALEVPGLLQSIGTRLPGKFHTGSWIHRRKDGSLIEVDIASHALEYLGRPARFVVAYDITELRRAERALRIASVVFDESREGIVVADADRRIVMVNRSFGRITGYDSDEAIGRTTALLKSGRHGADFYRAMWSALDTHGFWRGHIWNKRKNGEIYREWLSISTVKDEQGAAEYYIAIFVEQPDGEA